MLIKLVKGCKACHEQLPKNASSSSTTLVLDYSSQKLTEVDATNPKTI